MRHPLKTLLLAALIAAALSTRAPAAQNGVLTITFTRDGGQIAIASDYKDSRNIYLSLDAKKLIADGETLYNILETRNNTRLEKLEQISTELGAAILGPLRDSIASASAINFVVTDDLIDFPLDILRVNGDYLFLQKPAYYSFAKIAPPEFKLNTNMTALIISDPTADPENACGFVNKMLPKSELFDIRKVSLASLKNIGKRDILLFSMHGKIKHNKTDYQKLNGEKLLPEHIAHIKPFLVYYDSCNTAVSLKIVKGLKDAGVTYYLSPVTMNEAGTSSTETIKTFFTNLSAGRQPVDALFATRADLFKKFTEGDSSAQLMMRFWRSFPFRIYVLDK